MPESQTLRRASREAMDFTGWRVVFAGSAVWALQSFVWFQGFGNLAVALRDQFGWSKTLFSVSFAASRLQSAVIAPPLGEALRRSGPGRMMRIGAFFSLVGFILISTVSSKTMFVVAILVIGLGATLAGFLTISTATVAWFQRRRARALSYQSMGFAVGGFAGPLLVVCFNLFGWRATMAGAGVLVSAVAWFAADTIGADRKATGEPLDGIDPDDLETRPHAEGVQDHHFTAAEAVRTRAFWMIALGHGSALLVVSSSMAHLTLYLTEDRAYSAGAAAIVAGFVPLFQFVGTAVGGVLGDRFNKRLISGIAMVAHGGGLLLLTYAVHWTMIAGFVVLHGLAWGSRGPQMNALRADYFGTESFGSIMGWSSLIVVIGSIGGPILAGTMADATGDYRLGFTVLALAAIAGTIFWVFATPPPTPAGARSASGQVTP